MPTKLPHHHRGRSVAKDYEPIWVSAYDAGVPRTIAAYPDRTLVDYLADHARTHPDALALWYKGRRIGWRRKRNGLNGSTRLWRRFLKNSG